MQVQQLPCGHVGCLFCGRCHSWECSLGQDCCESARWKNVIEATRACGYQVMEGENYIVVGEGQEALTFVMRSEELETAEEWVTDIVLKHLGELTRFSWWRIAWEGVKAVCRSLFRRKAKCEVCGEMFSPEVGYYERDEYSYCRDCCPW